MLLPILVLLILVVIVAVVNYLLASRLHDDIGSWSRRR